MTATENTLPPSRNGSPKRASFDESRKRELTRIYSASDSLLKASSCSTISTLPSCPYREVGTSSYANDIPESESIDVIVVSEGAVHDSISEASDEVVDSASVAQTSYTKSKRSSSVSNDQSHERDRFRARFKSFNSQKSAIIEDQSLKPEMDGNVFEDISSKTKKLNIKPEHRNPITHDEAAKKESTLELKCPLNRESPHFDNYLPYPTSETARTLDIRRIDTEQLMVAFDWYFNSPLPPTGQMFPWLHGLHPENFAQRSFFISQPQDSGQGNHRNIDPDCTKPKNARFIMCVETSRGISKQNTKILRNTVSIEEILQRIEFARSEVISTVTKLLQQLLSSKAFSTPEISDLTESIIRDCLKTGFMPAFVDSDPTRGISLRNFQIQVNKIAKCADFVVYCHDLEHKCCQCKCSAFARLLRIAQLAENTDYPHKYDTFVFDFGEDSTHRYDRLWTVRENSHVLASSEFKKKTQLNLHSIISSNHDTFASWDADFQVKEKLETTVMSAASKLCLNVWSGNMWDHQIMMQHLKERPFSNSDAKIEIIPIDGGKDNYCDPNKSLLTRHDFNLAKVDFAALLPPPRSHWQLFIYCHSEAPFPTQSLLDELLFKYSITSRKASEVNEVHQIEFPSSGSIGIGDCRQGNLMSIVNTCKLIYLYSSSLTEDSLASLIYCSDGYTESALLVLCFLMYAEDMSLDQAMIKLHVEYGRPFYIFSSDVQVLRKFEPLLRKFSPARLGDDINWSHNEVITQDEINDVLLGSKGSGKQNRGIPRQFRLGYIATDSSSDSDDSDCEEDAYGYSRTQMTDDKWVEDLEGSLPSKILPYVYLGSLKHANNLTALSKLGITKIISVGESLEWLKDREFRNDHDIAIEVSDDNNAKSFRIHPKKRGSYTPRCDVTDVMELRNLQDDGIDDLSKSLPRIFEYIDREPVSSIGHAKFLIHCRVGVSRSATVVIAEVMRRLGLNLPQAYLYVRVRRLNIVIQPNLRFMYELLKWEEKVRGDMGARLKDLNHHQSRDLRVIDWFVMCQEIKKLNMQFVRP